MTQPDGTTGSTTTSGSTLTSGSGSPGSGKSDSSSAAPTPKADDSTTNGSPTGSASSYDEHYVRSLRQEAKKNRERYEAAEARVDKLTKAALEGMVTRLGTALSDPLDLLAFVDPGSLLDDEGDPDEEFISAAIEDLIEAKPHLAKKRQAALVDVGQGRCVEEPPNGDAFANWMRGTVR